MLGVRNWRGSDEVKARCRFWGGAPEDNLQNAMGVEANGFCKVLKLWHVWKFLIFIPKSIALFLGTIEPTTNNTHHERLFDKN